MFVFIFALAASLFGSAFSALCPDYTPDNWYSRPDGSPWRHPEGETYGPIPSSVEHYHR